MDKQKKKRRKDEGNNNMKVCHVKIKNKRYYCGKS